jgi:hypothetical protein
MPNSDTEIRQIVKGQDVFTIRIELPFSDSSHFISSQEENILCIDMNNMDLMNAFFGEYFVERYVQFLKV